MFTSLKKWVKNEDLHQRPSPPLGMQTMKSDLQRKFAKGVQYNLRIIIRGDRNTGKTCLWHRLQGQKFVEEYIPTAEIQVSSIHWNYKATDDVVKVDVWDVVDQGKNKKKPEKGLKLTSGSDANEKDIMGDQVLDASFLDVYKGAHAVIMMFDVTKKWTYSYIERELPKVPSHLPVLVLANFRDMGHHRVITTDEVEGFIESIDRPPGSPSVMFFESSMKNGFALKYVHKFFNLPFLLVQRESLLKQLETNHLDLESCMEELGSEEHNYEKFQQMLKDKREGKPVSPPPAQPPTAQKEPSNPPTEGRVNGTPQQANLSPRPSTLDTTTSPQQKATTPDVKAPTPSGKNELFSPSQMEGQSPTTQVAPEPEKRGFMSRFFRRSSGADTGGSQKGASAQDKQQPSEHSQQKNKESSSNPVTNVEEFVPDEGSVDDFLNDATAFKQKPTTNTLDSSDDEVDNGNPMVAGFQEDLDSDDQAAPSYNQRAYSSSDSEAETAPGKAKFAKTQEHKTSPLEQRLTSPLTTDSTPVPHLQELEDSSDEEDILRPEITHDADLSSEDGDRHHFFPPKIAMHKDFTSSDEEQHQTKLSNDETTSKENKQTTESTVYMAKMEPISTGGAVSPKDSFAKIAKSKKQSDSDSDDDGGINTMVSTTYDDLSSAEETVTSPPIAIVTPLQAERTTSWNGSDHSSEPKLKPTEGGLNLELDAADLDFLESTTKSSKDSSVASERRKSSKDGKSKKSSRTKEAGSEESVRRSRGHHKHKKHKSKDAESEEKTGSIGERTKSHRSKEEREKRKKKKKSQSGEDSVIEDKNAKNDLEAFLGGQTYEAL